MIQYRMRFYLFWLFFKEQVWACVTWHLTTELKRSVKPYVYSIEPDWLTYEGMRHAVDVGNLLDTM